MFLSKIPLFPRNKIILALSAFCIIFICPVLILKKNKLKDSSFLIKIPKKDQLILEDFFQSLIINCDFGYVLFGNKPMSMTHYVNPVIKKSIIDYHEFTPYNLKMKNGMECWRKYHGQFNSAKFMFVFFGNSSKDPIVEMALINKRKFIEGVQENLHVFQPIFGRNITGAKLIEKIANDPDFLENLNYEMLGILFGYGSLNSKCFQRRADINPKLYGWRFTLKKLIETPLSKYATIDDEIHDIAKYFRPLKDGYPLDEAYMDIPGFLAIPDSEETISLKRDFIQQRKKMIKIYRDGNFFKKTMLKYMEGNSDF